MKTSLSSEEIALVQATFKKLLAISTDKVISCFYETVFALDPSLRQMFKIDMTVQKHAFMGMLQTLVYGLHDEELFIPVVEKLGQAHIHYGVKKEHYYVIGEALIKTVEAMLGNDCSDQIKGAWDKAYKEWSRIMIESSYHLTSAL